MSERKIEGYALDDTPLLFRVLISVIVPLAGGGALVMGGNALFPDHHSPHTTDTDVDRLTILENAGLLWIVGALGIVLLAAVVTGFAKSLSRIPHVPVYRDPREDESELPPWWERV